MHADRIAGTELKHCATMGDVKSMTHSTPLSAAPQPDPIELSKSIRERAYAEGFDKVGIVRAAALASEGERLRQWLELGYHGEMQWLAREPDLESS